MTFFPIDPAAMKAIQELAASYRSMQPSLRQQAIQAADAYREFFRPLNLNPVIRDFQKMMGRNSEEIGKQLAELRSGQAHS